MAVTKPSDKATKPVAKAKKIGTSKPPVQAKRGPKGPTGGLGKRRKVFSESLGTAHLLDLSHEIAQSTASSLEKRLKRAKESDEHRREKRRVKHGNGGNGGNGNGQGVEGEGESSTTVLSKNRIRKALLEKQRDKSRRRKEARKQQLKDEAAREETGAVAGAAIEQHAEAETETESGSRATKTKTARPKKRVSFA